VQAAWEAEIGKRIAELDSGKAKTTHDSGKAKTTHGRKYVGAF
jgi:hypothetical protein